MSAIHEIERVLGRHRGALAAEVYDALNGGGHLIEPGRPLELELSPSRAVTHESEVADGVTALWCGDVLAGLRVSGFRVRNL